MIAALVSGVLAAGVLASATLARSPVPVSAPASTQLSAADAAPFIGDWTLVLQGGNGPGTFLLSLKMEKAKVVGEISSDQLPTQPISEITLVDKTLVLSYSFTWEGNPVAAVVSLIPAAEGKTTAQMDFAGGAYVMTGTATKKDREGPK